MKRYAFDNETSEVWSGSRTKESFRIPLDAWAESLGVSLGRKLRGMEVEDDAPDPRQGDLPVFTEPVPPTPPPTREAVFDAELAAANTPTEGFAALKKWRGVDGE